VNAGTVVVMLDAITADHVVVALRQYAFRGGHRVPDEVGTVADQLDAVTRHQRHRVPSPGRPGAGAVEDSLMTYTETAQALGVSTRTVSRYVAAGLLTTVGRRITARSVTELTRGGYAS
jgi:hypothetical protein